MINFTGHTLAVATGAFVSPAAFFFKCVGLTTHISLRLTYLAALSVMWQLTKLRWLIFVGNVIVGLNLSPRDALEARLGWPLIDGPLSSSACVTWMAEVRRLVLEIRRSN